MNQSPGLARALPRSRAAIATAFTVVLLVAAGAWTTVARAIPPGGPQELHPAGWSAKLDRTVVPGADGPGADAATRSKVTFTVAGVPENTVINAKIDDGLVKPAVTQAQDIVKSVTVPASGTISGTIDIDSDVLAADRDKLKSGRHNIRLVGQGYSFRLDFAVRSDLAPAPVNTPTRTVVVGPPADQAVAWANISAPYSFIPQLQLGSLIPYYATGFDPGQTVALKVDDNLVTPSPVITTGTDADQIWALLTADANGVVSGALDFPSVTAAEGTHWLRFLTGIFGGTGGSNYAPFAVKATTNTRVLNVAPTAQRGREVSFNGTGFKREPNDYTPVAGTGQTLTARLDGTGPAVDVIADGDGNVSGTLPLRADTPLGEHTVVVYQGFRTESDYPEAVYRRSVTVTEYVPDATNPPVIIDVPAKDPPVTVPGKTAKERSAKVASTKLKASKKGVFKLSIQRGSTQRKASFTVKTKSKYRVGKSRKKRVVSLVKKTTKTIKAGTTKQRVTVSLKLTKQGRALLKKHKKLRVVVRVAPKGGKAFTKTLTLR